MTAPRPKILLPDRSMLTPAEVAAVFGVDSRTIVRWAQEGRLNFLRLPGKNGWPGHRRFFRSEVDAMVNGPEAGK
jgi:excisionase family DNA binding protein